MRVDAEPSPPGDFADDGPETGIRDLGGPAAVRTHDMVVVRWGAADVGVLTRRQVEPFDDPEVGQDVEGPEDRRPADPETPNPGLTHEVGRREVSGPVRDQCRDGPPRRRQAVTGAIESDEQQFRISHVPDHSTIRALSGLSLNGRPRCGDRSCTAAPNVRRAVGTIGPGAPEDRRFTLSAMTIDTLRGKTASLRRSLPSLPRINLSARSQPTTPRVPSYGIGDADAHVFNCPVCARPLPDGTWRCPGCSTRLVFGVTLKRAGGLLSFGLVVGILFGGLAMSVAIGLGMPTGTTAIGNDPVGTITNPGTGPNASLAPGSSPTIVAPKAALSAMRQIALLDQRIAEDGAALKSAVKANRPGDIARALRTLGADASVGPKYLDSLVKWPEAAALAASRGDFYDKVTSTSRTALTKSISNKKAYQASGKSMLTVLKRLPKLDAAARVLATSAGSELPAVDYAAIK